VRPAARHLSLRTEDAYVGIRTIQELLGQNDVSTAMIDTHVINQEGRGMKSPVDRL